MFKAITSHAVRLGFRLAMRNARRIAIELRMLRETLQDLTDSYRIANQLAPLYISDAALPGGQEPSIDTPDPRQTDRVAREGDYLTHWLLEELASEHYIPITPDLDLEALGVERGWVTREGEFLVLPVSAALHGVDQNTLKRARAIS